MLRDGTRGVGLVVGGIVEADSERLHLTGTSLAHQCHDQARIETAAQERPQRHVADEAIAHRRSQQVREFLLQRLDAAPRSAGADRVQRAPVALDPGFGVAGAPCQEVPRLEAPDVAKRGGGRVDVPPLEEMQERSAVEHRLEARCGHYGAHLGCQQQAAALEVPEERLDAQAVAGGEKPALVAVPDEQGKHADESLKARFAPALVGAQDHLGVGARAEGLAVGLELGPDLGEVVDLAIEDDPTLAVGAGHGLVPGGREVENAEAAEGEPGPAIVQEFQAGVVGPAMRDGVAHAHQCRGVHHAI